MLGNTRSERLSILSFVVRRPSGRYLHHNFVVALLSDLFGIQSRGGCSCAGPYGHRLLGIDIERSHEFEHEITQGCEGIKPGWTRVSFNYFISETVFQYLVDAVDLVAEHGWKLLPEYRFNPATGLWRHHRGPVEPPLRLSQLSYDPTTGELRRPPRRPRAGPRDRARRLPRRRPATLRRRTGRGPQTDPHPGRAVGRVRAPALVRPPRRIAHRLTPRRSAAQASFMNIFCTSDNAYPSAAARSGFDTHHVRPAATSRKPACSSALVTAESCVTISRQFAPLRQHLFDAAHLTLGRGGDVW